MALDPDDWAYNLILTIDNTKIGSTLSSFPVSFQLSSSCGQDNFDATHIFDQLGSSSLKIAVTDSSYNELYVEIEYWNDTSELAYLHVNVTSISSSADTVLYLFYDSSQSDNTTYVGVAQSTPGQAVWDSDYVGVWHLTGDPSTASNILDSTNVNDGTFTNLESEDAVTDFFGGALDFDDEWMLFGDDTTLQLSSAITLEAVFKRDITHAVDVGIASKYYGATSNNRSYALYMNTSEQVCFIMSRDGDTDPLTNLVGSTVMGTADYYYGVGKYKSSDTTAELRLNASQETSTSSAISSMYASATAHFSIGNFHERTGTRSWGGRICEVRLSKIKRTDDWCDATYYSLFDDLITLSAPEAEDDIIANMINYNGLGPMFISAGG